MQSLIEQNQIAMKSDIDEKNDNDNDTSNDDNNDNKLGNQTQVIQEKSTMKGIIKFAQ